jgi:hypothetical protein
MEQVLLENIIILYSIYFILFIVLFTFWFLFLPQHFLRFLFTSTFFLLQNLLQRELLSLSSRRYFSSPHWCWTTIFYLGGVKDGDKITAIVNNKEGINGGRMNFLRDGIKIPHTVINIPSDGVYLGVCIIFFFFLFISLLFSIFNLYSVFQCFFFLQHFFYFPS